MGVKLTTLVTRQFEKVDIGDKRLNERCQKVVEAIAKHPDKSIPQACGDWSRTQGAYRFFSNENVSREVLLKSPIAHTVEHCQKFPEVIVIQDTTYLNFSGHKATEGLGPIGDKAGVMGLIVHSSLAVESELGEVLGLLNQEVWSRDGTYPRDETTEERQFRDRESQCWTRGIETVEKQLSHAIHVADREGDIYEALEELKGKNERFVIRAHHNRLLNTKGDKLFDAVKRNPAIGKVVISVPLKSGQKKRQAILTLRAVSLTIRPPKTLGREGQNLNIHVVETREEHAPKGCIPLHWVLLTSESIHTLESCVRVIKIYSYRWKIEEFHMGLKTGCRIEDRQLETRKRLEVFLGLCSIISVLLLRLRDAARKSCPASDFLTRIQLIVLHSKFPHLSLNATAREALRAVAQMGGFLARKGDGEPGWRTLWRGMDQLLLMEHGYLLAKNNLPLPSTIL